MCVEDGAAEGQTGYGRKMWLWDIMWFPDPVQVRCSTSQRWIEFPPKSAYKETYLVCFQTKVWKILHTHARVCVCVCVCERERETEGERGKGRGRGREDRDLNVILFLSGIIFKFNFHIFNWEHR